MISRKNILHGREVLIGVLGILTWGILFLAGINVNSAPYHDALAAAKSFTPDLLITWFIAFTCYTVTNALLLACLASVIGELGAHVRPKEPPTTVDVKESRHPYVGALTRGFFIYLVSISGVIITMDSPLTSPTPQQYVRLAGLISLLSFVMAYNPLLFSKIFNHVAQNFQAQDTKAPTEIDGSVATLKMPTELPRDELCMECQAGRSNNLSKN